MKPEVQIMLATAATAAAAVALVNSYKARGGRMPWEQEPPTIGQDLAVAGAALQHFFVEEPKTTLEYVFVEIPQRGVQSAIDVYDSLSGWMSEHVSKPLARFLFETAEPAQQLPTREQLEESLL